MSVNFPGVGIMGSGDFAVCATAAETTADINQAAKPKLLPAHKTALYYSFDIVDPRPPVLGKASAESSNAAYTGSLDLEDNLTARYAFAIERFRGKASDVSNLRIISGRQLL